jgi:outer membrane protein OmpA-like peptidoglycan-associated protein
MKKLADGEIDFAVATIDSYILNAAKVRFPGVIIAVIDESKGGDAILARKEKASNLDQIKNSLDLRIAFTPDSPSHFLAKAAAYHFSVPELLPQGKSRIETKGSEEALKKLASGKADVAILWEPDVSKALQDKDIVKILGTEDTERLIVDVLLVGRKFSQDNPNIVKQLLLTYFRVLKSYTEDSKSLEKHLAQETGLQEDSVSQMLRGVRWANLTENCEKWFGISPSGIRGEEDIISTIESTLGILINSNDFKSSPFPNEDPYRIIYSKYLEDLYLKGFPGFTPHKTQGKGSGNSLETKFSSLDSGGWDRLREVGTLKIDPIAFQHGESQLQLLAKQTVDKSVEMLKHYPNFRIVIKGHTDVRGDPEENRKLSQERADNVANYLEVVYSIDTNRIHAVGLGGSSPLPRLPGETLREWNYKLPRVELILVREDI